MNELQIFNNEEFGEIRTMVFEDKPYFCLADVCRILEIGNPSQLKTRLREDGVISNEVGVRTGTKSDGSPAIQNVKMTFISETNLYKTIFQSRKESAERFTDWVAGEVLPSIRKTGSYHVPMTPAEQIQLLAQGNIELEQKIDSVDKDLQDFKREMPLLAIECQHITEAKNRKVVPLLGGKESNAYKNASLRGKVYRDLEGQLRREFGVSSYKAIHRNQTEKALGIIAEYELPLCLAEQIADENEQINI